jgi:hypothetical protein
MHYALAGKNKGLSRLCMSSIPEVVTRAITRFKFLNTQHGFHGPYNWHIAYELQATYIKGNIYFNISYDGALFFTIGKTKQYNADLEQGIINLSHIPDKEKISHDIMELIPKKSQRYSDTPQSDLIMAVELVHKNPEILDGDWQKFSLRYKIIRKLFSQK